MVHKKSKEYTEADVMASWLTSTIPGGEKRTTAQNIKLIGRAIIAQRKALDAEDRDRMKCSHHTRAACQLSRAR
jgi:hypothetical protein